MYLSTTSIEEKLRALLLARQSKNPRYSLRSFARGLNIDPGMLSRILSGKLKPGRLVSERLNNYFSQLEHSEQEKKEISEKLNGTLN